MLFLFLFVFLSLSLSWESRIGISRHIWFIKPDRTLLHRILLRSRPPQDISAYLVSDKELSFGFPDEFCRIFWNVFATASFFLEVRILEVFINVRKFGTYYFLVRILFSSNLFLFPLHFWVFQFIFPKLGT